MSDSRKNNGWSSVGEFEVARVHRMSPTRRIPSVRGDGHDGGVAAKGKGHVESYFFKLNSPDSTKALWMKATAFVPKGGPRGAVAEAWAMYFERGRHPVAFKDTQPLVEAVFPRLGDPSLRLEVGDLHIRDGRLQGEWDDGARSLAAELELHREDHPPLKLFFHPKLYELPVPKTKLVTPYPEVTFYGRLVVDGEEVDVSGWRGMGGHNWGAAHTSVYAWSSVNTWEDGSSAFFEGVTARPRLGPWRSPPLTSVTLVFEGETFSFSGPWEILNNRGRIGPMRWSFRVGGFSKSLVGEVHAQPEETAGLYYRNPSGTVTHCLNSKLATARLVLKRRGCRDVLLQTRQAALELGCPDRCFGVEMLV